MTEPSTPVGASRAPGADRYGGPVRVLLLSTYELGHQPLQLATAAGALRGAGHHVTAVDLAVEPLRPAVVDGADAVAISVPMHTATRLALAAAASVRHRRPELPVALYGLYAAAVPEAAAAVGIDRCLAGEYEAGLVGWVAELTEGRRGGPPVAVSLDRRRGARPDRSGLADLSRYARVVVGGEERLAGYVEASRGCAHRCRHCPVPVVYDGRVRRVPVDDVLADVDALVAAGARHVTFGDPDFLNAPAHARRVIDAVHGAFPGLTFDVTVKVEHVLAHRHLWPAWAAAGCLFVVSAFESTSATVLDALDKGHGPADLEPAVAVLRGAGIEPRPSLVPFTPWTTAEDVLDLLDLVARADLVGNVDPVHYSIRLLVPPGSLLLASGHLDGRLGPYDPASLGWTWASPDPRLDALQAELAALAEAAGAAGWDPAAVYQAVRAAAFARLDVATRAAPAADPALASPMAVDARPRLTEAWFCCAEPTGAQLGTLASAGAG